MQCCCCPYQHPATPDVEEKKTHQKKKPKMPVASISCECVCACVRACACVYARRAKYHQGCMYICMCVQIYVHVCTCTYTTTLPSGRREAIAYSLALSTGSVARQVFQTPVSGSHISAELGCSLPPTASTLPSCIRHLQNDPPEPTHRIVSQQQQQSTYTMGAHFGFLFS